MLTFDPAGHPVPFVHQLLLSGVAPRPIALLASIDENGTHNLSPFSFFNAFGANPPIVAVSPAFRGSDGTPKHSYLNIKATREFTISVVTHSMLEQINLASSDFPAGVDEFVKAGFGKRSSVKVAPPGVAESPFVMECKLVHAYETGGGRPGSGNLLVGEVVCFHVDESVYTGDRLDPRKLDLVARMGYNWYCRANGDALFEVPKPRGVGIGVDALPAFIRDSAVLTGRDLARFGGLSEPPDPMEIESQWEHELSAMRERIDHGGPLNIPDEDGGPGAELHELQYEMLTGAAAGADIANRLQSCARRFLEAGNIERAVFCAWVADPATIQRLRKQPF